MKHKIILLSAASFVLATAYSGAAHGQQTQATQQNTSQTSQTQSLQKASDNSVADAARKAREERKGEQAVAKTYTNDDVPTIEAHAAVSSVGQPEAAPAKSGSADAKSATAPAKTDAGSQPAEVKKDEAYWRKRFGALHEKLDLAEKELDVLQRELNLDQRQYYADPNQALQQQYSRQDINEKTDKIATKQKEVDNLKQQLSDLQDELRRAGGDPAWAQ